MSFTNFLKTYQLQNGDKPPQLYALRPKRQLLTYALYALLAVALLYLFVDPAAPATRPPPSSLAAPWAVREEHHARPPPIEKEEDNELQGDAGTSPSASSAPPPQQPPCDYSDGEWVPDPRPPPYDGAACGATKDDGRSCAANGRADTGYLHWRWQPRACDLPDFSPEAFLRWLRHRHLAFVGDSLARNQAESLVCLLSSGPGGSPAELVHRDPHGRFRRWLFPGHNATVSVFWSPFLVAGAEKSARDGVRYNQVFLDAPDERWLSQLGAIDAAVLSAGQWFRIPSVYHDGGRAVGCHGCAPELNLTETSFLAAFRDAVARTLAEVARRDDGGSRRGSNKLLVALATFSPSHFDGEWDKGAPCANASRPYRNGEKKLGYTETEMRKIVLEAVEDANAAAAAAGLRFAALDVTALANLRPDGHPGPYMRKNPFAGGGGGGRVQHDCLHWCMPGPVDTFNQILLQTILR